jgi:hypothetical protein
MLKRRGVSNRQYREMKEEEMQNRRCQGITRHERLSWTNPQQGPVAGDYRDLATTTSDTRVFKSPF